MKTFAALLFVASMQAATINYSFTSRTDVTTLVATNYTFVGNSGSVLTVPNTPVTIPVGSLTVSVDPSTPHGQFAAQGHIAYTLDGFTSDRILSLNFEYTGGQWTYAGVYAPHGVPDIPYVRVINYQQASFSGVAGTPTSISIAATEVVQPAPEPSTFAFMGIAGLAVLVFRKSAR